MNFCLDTHTHISCCLLSSEKNIVVSIGIAQFVDIISTFHFYNIQQNMIDFFKNLQNILFLLQGSFRKRRRLFHRKN